MNSMITIIFTVNSAKELLRTYYNVKSSEFYKSNTLWDQIQIISKTTFS